MKHLVAAIAAYWLVTDFATAEIGIISPAQAQRLIEAADDDSRPVILDARGAYKVYFRSHLPTAQYFNPDILRGPDRGVPLQYLGDETTKAMLLRAGVDRRRTHLIYAAGGTLPNDEILSACMLAYVLEKFGVEDIRIIDGGFTAWQKEKFPVTQEYFSPPIGTLPKEGKKDIGIGLEELLERKTDPNVILVDARPRPEFIGVDDVWMRKGHIPGAISFHWARLTEETNSHQLRPFDEIKDDLEAAGITPDKEIIVYCGTSREATLLRFYLKHIADYPNVRLYEGSWKEYMALKEHPVEIGANDLKK